MKVIFLDVDGVLNRKNTDNQGEEWGGLNSDNISKLKHLVQKTGAHVVMSSGWRLLLTDKLEATNPETEVLINQLAENGIHLIDKTPDFSDDEIRRKRTFSHVKGKEILHWLSHQTDIETFVVIDDLSFGNEEILSHLVQTNPLIGLSDNNVEKALKILT